MLLDEYGLHPYQMERYTGHEITALERYHRWKMEQRRLAAEGV